MHDRKKVLLIVIDALATEVVVPAIESGRLPTLAALLHHGSLRHTTAIFPSITPAATASIVTGCYPCEHGISGAYWWDEDAQSVAFFGSDLWMIYNKGVGEYFRDFMVSLNEKYLKADPIFQVIEREDRVGAVINFMWYRGDCQHDVNAPLLLELLVGSDIPETVSGPTVLALADFVSPHFSGTGSPISGGITRRYGFHDDVTSEYLSRIFDEENKPDFTLAYFPNNDFDSHTDGPTDALAAVEAVDKSLAEFFREHGGLETFLRDFTVVVCGDHSQSVTLDDAAQRDILLEDLLTDFHVACPNRPWEANDEVLPCPNLRAAQIYLSGKVDADRQQQLIDALVSNAKVDQVLVKAERSGRLCFDVVTADRGSLSFRRANSADETLATDEYGNHWTWTGDLSAVDASHDGDTIAYGDYPNALERIASGFAEPSASLWVTARLGHEFRTADTHTHPGGSHGSLHRLDSTSPFIVAGLPESADLPVNPRTTDIAAVCRQAMGLAPYQNSGKGR